MGVTMQLYPLLIIFKSHGHGCPDHWALATILPKLLQIWYFYQLKEDIPLNLLTIKAKLNTNNMQTFPFTWQ